MGSCDNDSSDDPKPSLELVSLKIDNNDLLSAVPENIPVDQPIIASFSVALDTNSIIQALTISDSQRNNLGFSLNYFNSYKAFTIYLNEQLEFFMEYTITLTSDLKSQDGKMIFPGGEYKFVTLPGKMVLESITAGGLDLAASGRLINIPLDLEILATFSSQVDNESVDSNVSLKTNGKSVPVVLEVDGNILKIIPEDPVDYLTSYSLILESDIRGIGAVDFEGFETSFYTELDSTLKFPEISDEDLLTKIQEQTFKYFWDFGHPVSGLSRERNKSGETVTSGGSGFGVMAIIVGIERGFIQRSEGVDRLLTIVNFLLTQADRFHGAWSHWLNGTTGKVRPFSSNDDGGDLVETSFMIQGLLTARQYLSESDPVESEIITKINILWEDVEWDWYTQDGQDVLYWHWSPNFGWEKNHRISGWNEALIVYVLAAGSPTHTIDKEVYQKGWARSGNMKNGSSYYDITLPLGPSKGGPLFFSHYSFLGLDPRNLRDQYADYWQQNINHSKINFEYCVANPKHYVGYGNLCWGLTASDNHEGYSAHSPTNDKGVITPTAAISSLPYTPDESMAAIRHFYYILGDRLWGNYGFYDAFNVTEGWYADSYIAIDQGPIICMIENYRTGLLWDLFMSAPEVQNGLTKLGFTYE